MPLALTIALLAASSLTPEAQRLDALAAKYAMAGRHDQAARVLAKLFELVPSEDLRLRLARNQAWAGWTAAATRTYELYLKARPDDRQAALELIRLKRWRGDYAGAEKLCDRLLARNANDAEVLALKAEVLHWAGNRTRSASRSAKVAARIDPQSPDARVARIYTLRDQGERREASREFQALSAQVAQRGGITPDATYGDAYRLLETEFARSGHAQQPAVSIYNDSDGIHNVYAGLQLTAPVLDHRLRLDLGQWRTSAPLGGVFTRRRERSFVTEFTAGGVLQAAPSVYVTALGGASRRASSTDVRPIFDFQVSAAPIDRWTFDFQAGREFLRVTPRAVDLDLSSYRLGAGAQYHFDSRTSLAVRADRRWWSDDNRSLAAEASLRRILHYYKPFMVDGGLQARWEHFARDTRFASGFFTPERYRRYDGLLGIHGELNHRLRYEIRGAAGTQQLSRGGDYRFSWEVSASTSVRLAGPLELYGAYQRRNYSLVSREGWYHGFFVALGIRP
jgi:Flp pilus assembly protein TadD